MNDSKWLNLGLLIPVAAGSLLLSVGCSHERSVARKYCKAYAECEEDRFDDEYGSIAECTRHRKLLGKADNYAIKIDEGPECLSAVNRLESCFARRLDCDFWDDQNEWVDKVLDECEDRVDAVEDECDYSY